jgi:hypothetical protein
MPTGPARDTLVHLRNKMVDEWLLIKLKKIPLHMWTHNIVEQMLGPYFTLEHID